MGEKLVVNKVIKSEQISWQELHFIQSDRFKELTPIERHKLKASIVRNQFVDAFRVWEAPDGRIFCLDGKHRTILLQELIGEGYEVLYLLPANFLECANEQEAAKLVLVYSSQYARITRDGLEDFISQYDLSLPELLEQVSIPVMDELKPLPLPDEINGHPKDKPPVMKITFETSEQLDEAIPLVEEYLKIKFPNAFFSVSCGEI